MTRCDDGRKDWSDGTTREGATAKECRGAFRRQEENWFSPNVIQRNAALLAPRH